MSEKTEQPTQKRLREARKKGDVAYSKDFTQTLLILAIFGYLLLNGQKISENLAEIIILPTTVMHMNFHDAANTLLNELLWKILEILAPFILILLAFGFFGDALQVGFILAFEKIKPSAKKINPIQNLKNIFSKKNLVEFIKSIIKIAFLSTLIWLTLREALPMLVDIPHLGISGMGLALGILVKTLLVHIALAYGAIALADLAWQRMQFRKGQMMSKDEVKREYKEMEGDAHIKHQRKQLHKELLQQNAIASARKATVIVTNPTHLAVALHYDEDQTPLPVLLALGEGALAERMVQAAREAGVPVMQNIALARALTAQGQVGQYIPSELVEPVAELLRLLQELEGGPQR